MVEGLANSGIARIADQARLDPGMMLYLFFLPPPPSPLTECMLLTLLMHSVLSDDVIKEVVPGNIRRAEHFLSLLRRFIEYLKVGATIIIALLIVILLADQAAESASANGRASGFLTQLCEQCTNNP